MITNCIEIWGYRPKVSTSTCYHNPSRWMASLRESSLFLLYLAAGRSALHQERSVWKNQNLLVSLIRRRIQPEANRNRPHREGNWIKQKRKDLQLRHLNRSESNLVKLKEYGLQVPLRIRCRTVTDVHRRVDPQVRLEVHPQANTVLCTIRYGSKRIWMVADKQRRKIVFGSKMARLGQVGRAWKGWLGLGSWTPSTFVK